MADLAAAVTDTHALLFHAAGGSKLGPRARVHFQRCENREAILYVPVAVIWRSRPQLSRGTVPKSRTPCS